MAEEYIVVLVTAPRGKGVELARSILEKRLAACINIYKIRSIYWWKDNIEEGEEDLLIIKTLSKVFKKLSEEIKKIHPYQVPEIIALPIVDGDTSYLEWIQREVRD